MALRADANQDVFTQFIVMLDLLGLEQVGHHYGLKSG